jgi:uncharacterized protein (TIGR00296 family)
MPNWLSISSAFDDTRFNPISARELPSLECAVTLLTNFEPASSPLDWSLGVHGIRISFSHHSRRYGATYLPDVALEQGWTKEETLVSLMRKAGYNGRKDDWKKVDLQVVRYQGKKVSLDYGEWKEWRAWVREEMADDDDYEEWFWTGLPSFKEFFSRTVMIFTEWFLELGFLGGMISMG